MKVWAQGFSIAALAIALASCGGHSKREPTGQVAAVVDGQEITVRDVQFELAMLPKGDAAARKAAEKAALQSIVVRKLIARAAEQQEIDKTPEFALEKKRAEELALAKGFQDRLVKNVPAPTPDEVNQFIAANPNVFAERKIFIVDQISFRPPSEPNFPAQLQPLKTMADIEGLLNARGIPFRRGVDRIDATAFDPVVVNQIVALPPGEVFVVPVRDMFLVNVIQATQVAPLTGAAATVYARDLLQRQRINGAMSKTLQQILSQSDKLVRYNKAFAPAPRPAAPPAPNNARQGAPA
jgi:peptidyl-prolyl cis-trans isomerase C